MKIGLLGLTFASGNKGCEALSYSCLELLNQIAKRNNTTIEVCIIGPIHYKRVVKACFIPSKFKKDLLPRNEFKSEYSNLKIDVFYYRVKNGKNHYFWGLEKFDFVIDYTAGDSFTDIYGNERFFQWTAIKMDMIRNGIPLIMGSQTIGPFQNENAVELAKEVLNKSRAVFVRDEMSYEYTKKLSDIEPILTTDVAFLLPYKKVNLKSKKTKIGFNASGLLWNGGYTGKNEFGLTVEYQRYCKSVISKLIENGYEVHLILHAYYEKTGDYPDNDMDAVVALHKEYPNTIVAPSFSTPMEAKGYIAAMDLFTGARMHATIAAFSSGVPVIPFSYSRKFEGLFESLKYDHIIHGCGDSTDSAIDKFFSYLDDVDCLKCDVHKGLKIVENKNEQLIDKTERIIFS